MSFSNQVSIENLAKVPQPSWMSCKKLIEGYSMDGFIVVPRKFEILDAWGDEWMSDVYKEYCPTKPANY